MIRPMRQAFPMMMLVATLSGCQLIEVIAATPTAATSPSALDTATPDITSTPTPEPIVLPTAKPTETPPPSATPDVAWLPGIVHVYPGPEHYEGDRLSFEVVVENPDQVGDLDSATLTIDGVLHEVDDPHVAYSPLRQVVVVFRWAWDTTNAVGTHEIHVSIPDETGNTHEETFYVEVLPDDQRPISEAQAEWELASSACCDISYITGTAADRDLEAILTRSDAAVVHVEEVFGTEIDEVFPIILLDNIWGNGAFASNYIVLSYVDRAYVSINLDSVIRHEAVHYATRNMGRNTPIILVEGIAVYVSGGHYKPEPISQRTAALLALNRYIPLADLANDFRDHQHEIAYLEAAGLIEYLSQTYGWETFLDIYDIPDVDTVSSADWLNEAFKRTYDKGLTEIEAEFITWLQEQDPGGQTEDLRLTIELFDTIRHYQTLYAPYQEDLSPLDEATENDITAEYMREPTSPENVALEITLIHAREALEDLRFDEAQFLIDLASAVMADGDFSRQPIADFLAITLALRQSGYEAQHIEIVGERASAVGIREWPVLESLALERVGDNWQIVVSAE